MTRRRLAVLAVFIVLCVAALAARGESTVVLKGLARVAPGSGATLGDVAHLRGEAAALAAVSVLTAADLQSGSARVELSGVRELVEKNARDIVGRTSFSGSVCVVRVAAAHAATAPPAPVPPGAAASAGGTVRDHVRARIAQACGAAPADLQLTFLDGAELLDTPAGGRTVAVNPAAMGDTMPLSVRVYAGDVLLVQGVVRVGVLVRREVLVATTPLSRGSAVSIDAVEPQEQWLAPSVAPASVSQVTGSVARARVEAGRVVMARDVEPPVVVQRGDLVSIDCISGTVVVSATARAKEAGREGDVVQFQSLTSKKTFAARVSGPGKAVLVAEGQS